MWWAVLKCVKILLVAVGVSLVISVNTQAWSVDRQPEHAFSELKVPESPACSGFFGMITVSGEGSINACIMGQGIRVASYFPVSGGAAYAISFPFENTFYRLDICEGVFGCVYAEETDTLLGLSWLTQYGTGAVVYREFAKHVVKTVQQGVTHYGLGDESPSYPVTKPDGSTFYAKSLATSSNGEWLAVEMRDIGVVRINTQSLEVRRVVAPGYRYGLGNDPLVEMAISNDGHYVALMGYRIGVAVVAINDTCGDVLSDYTEARYVGAVTPCPHLQTPTDAYIAHFAYAHRPQFSWEDKTLSFDVFSHTDSPKHVTLFSDVNASQNSTYYVAIGDSFTSGEGEVDDSFYIGGATERCHVSSRSYPFLLATSWGVSVNNSACSGATMETARGNDPKGHQRIQVSEIEVRAPQVLSVGIGGNDAGLMGKLKTCLGPSTCEWARTPSKRQSTALEIRGLFPRLKQFYQELKTKAPGRMIVIGYPLIISAEPVCIADAGVLLNQAERRFMNEGIHYLNQVIKAAAYDIGVEYVDVENAFAGSELCALSTSLSMNGLRLGDDYPIIDALSHVKIIGAESFHPTPLGHQRLAETILRTVPDVRAEGGCLTCGATVGAPSPSSYWDAEVVGATQRRVPFIQKMTIKKKDTFEISLPMFSFRPLSEVTLELHSDVTQLGMVTSAKDGSVRATISVDVLEPGSHSVHAIGKGFTGDDIDIYDFLAIKDDVTSVVATVDTLSALVDVASTEQGGSLDSASFGASHAPAGVLGASLLNTPVTDGVEDKKTALTSAKSFVEKSKQPLNGYIAGGIGVSLSILSSLGYWYYRKKQARYP